MRRLLALAAPLVLAVSVTACGDDDDDDDAASADTTTTAAADEEAQDDEGTQPADTALVNVGESDLGELLVTADGTTLYLFTQDTADTSACTDGCSATWPPLLVDGAATGGEGVDEALLGTIERGDGSMQITYNDHPLYTYVNDTAPGDTTGHTVGDVWYAVSPAGEAIS